MKILIIQAKIGMGDMIIYLPYIHAISKKYNEKVRQPKGKKAKTGSASKQVKAEPDEDSNAAVKTEEASEEAGPCLACERPSLKRKHTCGRGPATTKPKATKGKAAAVEKKSVAKSGSKAGKGTRAYHGAKCRCYVANSISLKLLRRRPLLMDVLTLPVTKSCVHFLGVASINDLNFGDINACLSACIFEHCHRLTTVMHKHFRPFQR